MNVRNQQQHVQGHNRAVAHQFAEYRTLGARDQPSVYISVKEDKNTNVRELDKLKTPVFPNVPVVIEHDDPQSPTAPHASPTFVGNSKHADLGRYVTSGHSRKMDSLGVSQEPIPGGIKTPSRVPREYQELNFQQIQILIDRLEALKDASPDIKQPLAVTNTEDEHLYEHIPESEKEYSTERYEIDNTSTTRPPLPPKPPKPKPQHTQVVRNVASNPKTRTLTKPKKSLGE